MTCQGYLQDGSRDMNEMIEGLLKLSRSTCGELLRERIDLDNMANNLVVELCKSESERQVDVKVAADMRVAADPDHESGGPFVFIPKRSASHCASHGIALVCLLVLLSELSLHQ